MPTPIHWLVLTEHWCGDAAQSLPVMASLAAASPGKINFKLVYRNENPDLMDAFLTNGARAIPLLIQLNSNLKVTGTWGPRPEFAKTLVKELRSNPAPAENYGEHLHKWYAKNKQVDIQDEITILIHKAWQE